MPRTARKKTESGIYHVMIHAEDDLLLFKDAEDHDKFRSIFNTYRAAYSIRLYAWCMMSNHIHLIIKDSGGNMSTFFRITGSNYVGWYNRKYDRTGHLFRDRFRSEPIEDAGYLLKAIRYIHMNPVQANICDHPGKYKYSSYSLYFGKDKNSSDILFGSISRNEFERFHFEKNEDHFLDADENSCRKLTDEDARRIIIQNTTCENIDQFRKLPAEEKKQVISLLLRGGGSIRQICMLTGVSVRMVRDCSSSSIVTGAGRSASGEGTAPEE